MTKQGPYLSWKSLAVIVGCALAGCSKDAGNQEHSAAATAPPPMPKAVAEPVAEVPIDAAPSPLEQLMAADTLAAALEHVKPEMSDTNDEISRGALLLAVWANAKLRWSDVAIAKNETSFALIRKDADASRGKRLCVRGTIIQIQREDGGDATFFTGLMLTNNSDISSFIAVGSTGELVERRSARFCGVVIGTYDYSNSGGGKGHAISVVGMFDLPENRAAVGGR